MGRLDAPSPFWRQAGRKSGEEPRGFAKTVLGCFMFGILLKGKPKVKCKICHGKGYVYKNNALKACKNCDGKGFVETVWLAENALARFNQPRIYKVSHEHSVMLVYRGYVYDEVLMALRVLAVSDIKAEIVFQV